MPHKKNALHIVSLCVSLIFSVSTAVFAQDDDANKAGFLGPDRCEICHRQADPVPSRFSRDFCQMNEFEIYQKDKHFVAFKALTSAQGQKIGERLKINVTKDMQCLSCHYGASDDEIPTLISDVTELSCEACHGPSQRWDKPHSVPRKWRVTSPQEKESFGMTDLRDPVRRAKVCVSCHIGNHEQGKVVTHAMYAAGHPPLSGFEIEAYMTAMPRHWLTFKEKGNFNFRKQYMAVNSSVDDDFPRTKSALVGGIVAFGESSRLVAAVSKGTGHPEFAVYDCESCHHELRRPSWRQYRPSFGKPGRPRLTEWPSAILQISATTVLDDRPDFQAQFESKLNQVQQALNEQPFGEPGLLAEAIDGQNGISAEIDKSLASLKSRRLDWATVRQELRALYELKSTCVLDFHSARQVARIIRVIELELRTMKDGPKFRDREEEETLEQRTEREMQDRMAVKTWRETVQKHLEEITSGMERVNLYLHLEMSAGQKDGDNFHRESMKRIAEYDPQNFRERLLEAMKHSSAFP